jgi:hypothetical protein
MKRKLPRHEWKLKQPDRVWRPSDERDITASYIGLASRGKLSQFVRLRTQYAKLYLEWQEIWSSLIETGRPQWLDKFAMKMQRQNKNFQKSLETYISNLDRRRLSAKVQMRKVADGWCFTAHDCPNVGAFINTDRPAICPGAGSESALRDEKAGRAEEVGDCPARGSWYSGGWNRSGIPAVKSSSKAVRGCVLVRPRQLVVCRQYMTTL